MMRAFSVTTCSTMVCSWSAAYSCGRSKSMIVMSFCSSCGRTRRGKTRMTFFSTKPLFKRFTVSRTLRMTFVSCLRLSKYAWKSSPPFSATPHRRRGDARRRPRGRSRCRCTSQRFHGRCRGVRGAWCGHWYCLRGRRWRGLRAGCRSRCCRLALGGVRCFFRVLRPAALTALDLLDGRPARRRLLFLLLLFHIFAADVGLKLFWGMENFFDRRRFELFELFRLCLREVEKIGGNRQHGEGGKRGHAFDETNAAAFSSPSAPMTRAASKSMRRIVPSRSSMRFSGLMSRWRMRCAWSTARPSASASRQRRASRSVR